MAAIEAVLVRIGQLAEEIPEVAELDCNPLVASASGALVLDVKVRLEPRVRTVRIRSRSVTRSRYDACCRHADQDRERTRAAPRVP